MIDDDIETLVMLHVHETDVDDLQLRALLEFHFQLLLVFDFKYRSSFALKTYWHLLD